MEFVLELFFVGMITVLISLFIVVLIGNGLVVFSNKFLPAEVKTVVKKSINKSSVSTNAMAAIVAAVQEVTHGKGNVIDIKKL